MNLNPSSAAAPRHLAIALFLIGVAGVVLAALPADVLAEAGKPTQGTNAGGTATDAALAFKDQGGQTARNVGIVIFSAVAIFAIARATVGGKAGQGLIAFAVACLGMSVTLDPEAVMSGLGGWVTGLFAG